MESPGQRRGECESPGNSACMARRVRAAGRIELMVLPICTVPIQHPGRGPGSEAGRSKGQPWEESGSGAGVGGRWGQAGRGLDEQVS